MDISLASSAEPAHQVAGKGFGIRAGAYVIDVVVLWITSIAMSFAIGLVLGIVYIVIGQELVFSEQGVRALDLLIGLITSTLYFITFEWLYGATPGKLILGMRVIMQDGRNCTLGAACIRAVLRYIDGLFFGIPAYFSMKEPLLQRMGDKAAKTVVVSAKDPFIQHTREWWWLILALGIYLGLEFLAVLIQTISLLR
jgi:uncharacterized RDD family membrane protein YckC